MNPATQRIESIDDLFTVVAQIEKNRTTVATKMNLGSSRSHAALILTLHQEIDGMYQKTKFHLVDLAGAERPGKADGQRMTVGEAWMTLYME